VTQQKHDKAFDSLTIAAKHFEQHISYALPTIHLMKSWYYY